MTNNIITVNKESQGQRLDAFLVEKLSDLSRSKIQKMIAVGLVLVNGRQPTKHQFLKERDEIKIEDKIPLLSKEGLGEVLNVAKKGRLSKPLPTSPWKGEEIKIIDNTPDYLIIEKPSGLLVHPTEKHETNTLIDWASEKYPEIAKIGDEPGRAGIVHRLDKEVSGLMILPRTQDAFEYFKTLFKTRQIEKKYLAIVYGEVKSDTGEINFSLSRGKSRAGLFIASPELSGVGKPAKTLYWVKTRFKNYTLLEVEILTGRTHQIRVHLKALGHPVVGDELYKSRRLKEKTKINRIFLHAASLSFIDLHGRRQKYQSDLPEELKEFLKKIK